MTFLGFTGLINFASSAALAVVVFRKCPRRDVGVAYGLMNAAIAFWSFFYFIWQFPQTAEHALWPFKFLCLGAMWINQAFLYFTLVFLGKQARRRRLLATVACINVLFSILLLTNRFFEYLEPHAAIGLWPNSPSFAFLCYFIFWHAELLYAFGQLVRGLRYAEGEERNRLKYLIIAFAIGYFGGVTNWLPWFKIDLPPYLNGLVAVYCSIVAYAMVKHRLMNITIMIQRTLIYSIVSAGLAAVYAGSVTLLARLVENHPANPALRLSDIWHWFANYLRIYFAHGCLATAIFSIGLGIFVWFKGTRQPVHKLWMFFCSSIGFWSLGYGMMVRSEAFAQALLWERWIMYPGAIMIPVVFLHFVILASETRPRRFLRGGYMFAVLLQVVNAAGYLVSIQVQPPFNYYTLPLPPCWFFVGYFFFFVIYAHIVLIQRIYTVEGQLKNQLKFILLGTSIGFCGGSASFLPAYNIPIFPYGVFAVPIYIITVSYAIYRHRLMDLNVVIRKTFLYSLISAALAAIYVGTITLFAQVLGGRSGPASAFSSVLAAILITLLFNPLRIRTQRWIDRRFPRERLDPGLLQEAAGGFAHEMKRPLSKISLPAELTLMDLERIKNGEKTWEEFLPLFEQRLRFIISQSIDAGHMIEAIRELSATSAAPLVPVNLLAIVRNALNMDRELLEKRKVTVYLHFPEALPPVPGRARQLEIVFVNLIKNAVEALSELPAGLPRDIHIDAKSDGDRILVRVKDSGLGVKSEDKEQIFLPNYSTKGVSGTGMGLYLTSQIIQAHGGIIKVEPFEGIGTVFVVSLLKIQ